MDWPVDQLHIDPKNSLIEITNFLQDHFQRLNRRWAVIGLSGGLDSSLAATLTVRSLCADKVKLYYLPERDSNPIHRKHAVLLADKLIRK